MGDMVDSRGLVVLWPGPDGGGGMVDNRRLVVLWPDPCYGLQAPDGCSMSLSEAACLINSWLPTATLKKSSGSLRADTSAGAFSWMGDRCMPSFLQHPL